MSFPGNQQEEGRVCSFIALCGIGNLPDVRKVADQLGDVDVSDLSGKTGLMAAAAGNRLEIMAFLLDRGADPNKANTNGTTPLMFAKTAAFAYGTCDGMKILLDSGADKNTSDKNGLTALDYTVRNSRIIREFLENY